LQIRAVTTIVLVQEMDRAIRFYRDVLGLELTSEAEDWALFSGQIGLMLSPEPLPIENYAFNAVSLAIEVDNAQAAFEELTGNGVAFFVPPTDVGGAVVATFRDTEGNLLQLLQRDI
jgi:predicted enzyme related to lactoylglutathione lyase